MIFLGLGESYGGVEKMRASWMTLRGPGKGDAVMENPELPWKIWRRGGEA